MLIYFNFINIILITGAGIIFLIEVSKTIIVIVEYYLYIIFKQIIPIFKKKRILCT